MHRYLATLKWIESQYESMVALVKKWSNINSYSENLAGLGEMLSVLKEDFKELEGEFTIHTLSPRLIIGSRGNRVEMPLGQALSIKKRPHAPIQVFLSGHMDTVYPPSSHFQIVEQLDQETLRGPGVTDLKGGLAIMLKALQALENSPYASQIGWEILLNPDEEIGSIGSKPLFEEAAKRHHVGLIFEPAFADGALVSARKGSANYTIIVRGQAAHAGRDFSIGRSSIYAIAHIIREIEELNHNDKGTTVNIGHIEGGGPINIVPDLAICRLNIRATSAQEMITIENLIEQIINRYKQQEEMHFELIEDTSRLPKPFDAQTQELFHGYQTCAEKLKIPFHIRESGGVCDGNILSAAGLPTIDSVGAVGGHIHTEEEYLLLPSLIERCQLVTLFLFKLATGEIDIPKGKKND